MSQIPEGPDRAPVSGMPTWVKVFGIVFGLLVLVVVGLHLTGLAPRGHSAPIEHGAQKP